jgi:hypothetical protein
VIRKIIISFDKFSEDMDFSLLEPNNTFRLENYFESIVREFNALGKVVEIQKKEKEFTSNQNLHS